MSDLTDQEPAQDEGAEADSQAQPAVGGEREKLSDDSLLVREGDLAGDYLERLLDLLDYDGDIDLDVGRGRALVSVEGGSDVERLVGKNGATLEALQELTRLAVQQSTGERSRLMLDVAGWREGRRDDLARVGRDSARKAIETGGQVRLDPMTPFERKIVHDAVAEVGGARSESEGDEPQRRVVVHPQS